MILPFRDGGSYTGVVGIWTAQVIVLIDRLDEGYEPDEIGIGIVDGIVYGTDDLRNKTANVKTVLFFRDNIFRAIQTFDQKLWNSLTAVELHGREGFKRCLKLTLYRPRDLISLLNTAFYNAKKQGRKTIISEDLEASANHISEIRFDDLGPHRPLSFGKLRERLRIPMRWDVMGELIRLKGLQFERDFPCLYGSAAAAIASSDTVTMVWLVDASTPRNRCNKNVAQRVESLLRS